MSNSSTGNSEQSKGFKDTIKDDLKQGDHFHTLKKDFKKINEFYLTVEQKRKLKPMFIIKRWFFNVWWISREMLMKLTPLRRLLLLIGILLLTVYKNTFYLANSSTVTFNWSFLGIGMILFVLMLELKDKLLANDELEAGRKIQKALMPQENPEIAGWSVWLYSKPANQVCGDLVDYISINTKRSGLIISDVAGKGLNADLFTTKLQATIRALISDFSQAELVKKVNSIFHRDSLRNIFASMLYAEISSEDNIIHFVNAGHLPPFLISKNSIKEMLKGEPALGLMPDVNYSNNTLECESGDVFAVYSDGVTEAVNESKEFFGKERLAGLLLSFSKLPVNDMGNSILRNIDSFVGEAETSDDISIIVIKKK